MAAESGWAMGDPHRDNLPPRSGPAVPGAGGDDLTAADPRVIASARPAAPVPVVSGYDLLSPIGEGGMGTVWRAVQLSTRREVALKFMRAPAGISARARARFEREVELAARLEHPNIARVYDSGLRDGVYHYAMELVDGRPLGTFVQAERLDRRRILSLMAAVCRAVEFAHRRGIIHRDLKPSNILVCADGSPKLLDFGLARSLAPGDAASPEITLSGEISGTLAYMSPEQARGEDGLDTRTDVYALGAVLYHLLTGALPHRTDGPLLEVLRRISEEPVRPARSLKPDVDAELDAVVGKALDLELEARYGSAGDLAADLDRYLTGRPVAARPRTTGYVLRKWTRRHRWGVGAAAAVVVALAAALAVYVHGLRRADKLYTTAVGMLAGNVFTLPHGPGVEEKRVAERRGVIRKAIDDAQRMAATAGADAASDRATAAAFAELGQMYEDQGQDEAAELAYRTALRPLQRIAVDGPEKARAALDLSVTEARLTRLYLRRHNVSDAARHLESAEHWLSMLGSGGEYAGQSPERLAYEWWALTTARCKLLGAERREREALDVAGRADARAEAAERAGNSNFLTRESRAASLTLLAACHYAVYRLPEYDSAEHLRRVIECLRQAEEVDRDRVARGQGMQARVDLAGVLGDRGEIALQTGGDDALPALAEAAILLEAAVKSDPERADWLAKLVRASESAAAAADRAGRAGEAAAYRRRASELRAPPGIDADAGGLPQDPRRAE